MTYPEYQTSIPTNSANWSYGLSDTSGHVYVDYLQFWVCFLRTWIRLHCCRCLQYRLRISDGWSDQINHRDGWSGFLGRLFQTKSVMGRLWDDHFRQLGHPPKFYRVQDASSGNNSPFWYHFRVILMTNHWKSLKIIKNHVFSQKWHKKKKTAGMLVTEVRSGDASQIPKSWNSRGGNHLGEGGPKNPYRWESTVSKIYGSWIMSDKLHAHKYSGGPK